MAKCGALQCGQVVVWGGEDENYTSVSCRDCLSNHWPLDDCVYLE